MKADTAATIARPLPGIAVFVWADIASFTVFFVVFMVDRLASPELFDRSAAQLDPQLGLANTLVLLTSGLCVRVAEKAHEHGAAKLTRQAIMTILRRDMLYSLKIEAKSSGLAAPTRSVTVVRSSKGRIAVLKGLIVLRRSNARRKVTADAPA